MLGAAVKYVRCVSEVRRADFFFTKRALELSFPFDRGRQKQWSRPPKVHLLMSNTQSHGGLGDGGGAICHRAGSPGGRLIQQMHVTPQQPALLGPRELKTRVEPVLSVPWLQ